MQPFIIFEANGVRQFSDGSIQVTEELTEGLNTLVSMVEQDSNDDDDNNVSGDDDDDDDDSNVSGDDDDDDLFGARSKKKHKKTAAKKQQPNVFQRLFGGNKKDKKKDKKQTTSSVKKGQNLGDPTKFAVERMMNMLESCIIDGSQDVTAAGNVELVIRPQFDFHASDITFEGSTAGARVIQIWFGSKSVYQSNSGTGVSTTVFAANNQLRGLLKGQKIKAGLDIRVLMSMTQAGTASATFTGLRPKDSSSC